MEPPTAPERTGSRSRGSLLHLTETPHRTNTGESHGSSSVKYTIVVCESSRPGHKDCTKEWRATLQFSTPLRLRHRKGKRVRQILSRSGAQRRLGPVLNYGQVISATNVWQIVQTLNSVHDPFDFTYFVRHRRILVCLVSPQEKGTLSRDRDQGEVSKPTLATLESAEEVNQ